MIYLLLIIVLHMILFILIAKFYEYLQKKDYRQRQEEIKKARMETDSFTAFNKKSRSFIDITFSSN